VEGDVRVTGFEPGERLVLVDGVCVLCTAWARFLAREDTARRFRVAAIQSAESAAVLAQLDLPTDRFDTIVLVDDGRAFTRSTAVLRILAGLPRPWAWLRVLAVLPAGLRDAVYGLVARNRYRWFGRIEACELASGVGGGAPPGPASRS
jgi:predicted DCC family thiol-disulfide oxidoreductase YuxK